MSTKGHKKKHVCALTHSLPFIGNKSSSPLTFTIQPVWKIPSLESINTPLAQTASPPHPDRPLPPARPSYSLRSPLTPLPPSIPPPPSPSSRHQPNKRLWAACSGYQTVRHLDAPRHVSQDSEDRVWHKMLHVKPDNCA